MLDERPNLKGKILHPTHVWTDRDVLTTRREAVQSPSTL